MQRLLELDIYSQASIVRPDSFFADVETIGLDILGRDYDALLRYQGGATVVSRQNGLSVTSPEKLRYFYASRVAPHSSSRVLELMQSASMLFEERRLAGSIGGGDVIRPMLQVLGQQEQERDFVFCETFDYIDVVASARYPGAHVFVLKQLPSTSKYLSRMTDVANRLVDEQAIPLFADEEALRQLGKHGLSGTIPFARTKFENVSESRLQEAVDEMTTNSLAKHVVVHIGPVEHSVGEN